MFHHFYLRLERRITRRYKNDVQPEEVLALRRTVARQLQEIGQMQQRQAEKGRKLGWSWRCLKVSRKVLFKVLV